MLELTLTIQAEDRNEVLIWLQKCMDEIKYAFDESSHPHPCGVKTTGGGYINRSTGVKTKWHVETVLKPDADDLIVLEPVD